MEFTEDVDLLLSVTQSGYRLNDTFPRVSSSNSLMEQLFEGCDAMPMDVDIQKDFANEGQHLKDPGTDGQSNSSIKSSLQLLAPQQVQTDGVTNQALTLEEYHSESSVHMTYQPEVLHHPVGSGGRIGATQESEPKLLPLEINLLPVGGNATPALPIFQVVSRSHQGQLMQFNPNDIEDFLSLNSPTAELLFGIGHVDGAETPAIEQEEVTWEVKTQEPRDQFQGHSLQNESGIAEPLQVELPAPLSRSTPSTSQMPSPHRDESSIERMAVFVSDAVKRYHNSGAAVSSNGKIQVHEVVIILLLAPFHRCASFLSGVMSFCNPEGRETQEPSDHFVAKDTKTIGRLWQKLKNNTNANYDTFARAMRVGRERQKEYFDYLDAGKGAKKRVYKLGPKCLKELERMRNVLQNLN